MNRRQMLQWLAGGAALAGAGLVVAPARTIFLPPRGGWPVRDRLKWNGGMYGYSWNPMDQDEVIMSIDPAVGDDSSAVTWLRKEFDRMVLIDYRVIPRPSVYDGA